MDLLLLVYFGIKNYFFKTKVPKNQRFRPAIPLFISVFSYASYSALIHKYNMLNELDWQIGAVLVPSFAILFAGSDLASSIITYFAQKKLSNNNELTYALTEGLRIVLVHYFMSLLISFFWTGSITRLFVQTPAYLCTEAIIEYDIATYYFDHAYTFPTTLSDATTVTTNPYNNSTLSIPPFASPLDFKVEDEYGNQMIQYEHDFIGINLYHDNPDEYLKRKEIDPFCT